MAWNLCLNHAPADRLKEISRVGIFLALTPQIEAAFDWLTWSSCHIAKLKPVTHKPVPHKQQIPGQVICSDKIWPPYITDIKLGTSTCFDVLRPIIKICDIHLYFIPDRIPTTYSNYTTARCIALKHRHYPHLFHSDNARKFTVNSATNFLSENGIAQSITCTHQPQKNSIADGINQSSPLLKRLYTMPIYRLFSGTWLYLMRLSIITVCNIRRHCAHLCQPGKIMHHTHRYSYIFEPLALFRNETPPQKN